MTFLFQVKVKHITLVLMNYENSSKNIQDKNMIVLKIFFGKNTSFLIESERLLIKPERLPAP
jgi:hypothetical protein